MKTILKKITLIALAALMLLTLVSCDKSKAIKEAFEEEDYTVSTVDSDNILIKGLLTAVLDDEQMEDIDEYELILCQKGLDVALIVKFPSAGDLKTFLTVEDEDGKKDTELYDDAKEDGRIKGNCWLLTLSSSAKKVFEEA